MERNFEILKYTSLFRGIEGAELSALLSCLGTKVAKYKKGETIFYFGERIERFGIVLSGQAQVFYDDYYGNRNILAHIDPGNLFGESFANGEIKTLPVSVIATAESEILFIECLKIASPCSKACAFHSKLIQNMLRIVSMKNVSLMQKLEFTSKRTTREKLLSYLSLEAKKAGDSHFSIPFNRQELADYLFVDRSAMSAELSKLRDDGILKFDKNRFELLRD